MQEEGKNIVIHQEKVGKTNSDAQSITVEKVKIEGEDVNDTILKVKVLAGSQEDRRFELRNTEHFATFMVVRSAQWKESFTDTIIYS